VWHRRSRIGEGVTVFAVESVTREEVRMFEPRGARRECRHPDACACQERAPRRIELWRLHGVKGDLCGAAIETRDGWALRLELDSELLQQLFQPSLVGLALEAARLKAMFSGWALIDEEGGRKEDA
jgi:hypothetical protein